MASTIHHISLGQLNGLVHNWNDISIMLVLEIWKIHASHSTLSAAATIDISMWKKKTL